MDRLFTLGFSACKGIGTKRFEKLVAHFGSAEKAWDANENDLFTLLGKK